MDLDKLTKELLHKKAEENNTIDLNAYAMGLTDLKKQLALCNVVSSCFYHPENEGTAKTFRDVSTNNWYYENELINLLGENIVSSIKHRFDK